MNWGDIRDWDPAVLESAAEDLKAALDQLRRHAEDLGGSHPREWIGEASRAARTKRGELVDEYEDVTHAAEPVWKQLQDAADAITDLHREQDEADELARRYFWRITDAGALESTLDGVEQLDPEFAQLRRDTARQLSDAISAVEDKAGEIDAELAAAMRRAHSPTVFTDEDGDKDRLALPPSGTDPAQVSEWWHGLSAEERAELIRTEPAAIGNLDGVPYSARHEANVARIPDERARLQDRLDELRAERSELQRGPRRSETSEHREYDERIERVENKLDALDALDGQIVDGNQVLALDTSGAGVRSAVGIGDVDSAANLSVYTPGMNSAVERNMDRYVDEVEELNRYANNMLDKDPARRNETAASVVWMDYHAPQTVSSVLSDSRAGAGAERLAGFMDGMQATRADDPPQRLAGVSHSYGTTTMGLALKQTDAADAFVTQGSPGWYGSEDLQVPETERFNLSARGDAVADFGGFVHGGNPSNDPSVQELSTDDAVAPDTGEELHAVTGHTDYAIADEEMSTSEYNTAAAIIGQESNYIDQQLPEQPEFPHGAP
ncbi:Alpha/beta hydrolase [Haloechinothrix alba]|uniref:Alpha/beta hydrolase n=1 Tax=Haloechinothrix alba TaxID=664784 RepID=A0A238W671_9PSEU|nr:alpha/beta hydrolase [Haloechinothrix alba]SNR41189.1 Alpha/beta hydrolase [Haloechinothrix alba]